MCRRTIAPHRGPLRPCSRYPPTVQSCLASLAPRISHLLLHRPSALCTQGIDATWLQAHGSSGTGGAITKGAGIKCPLHFDLGLLSFLANGVTAIDGTLSVGVLTCPPSLFVSFQSNVGHFDGQLRPDMDWDLVPGMPGFVHFHAGLEPDTVSGNVSLNAKATFLGQSVLSLTLFNEVLPMSAACLTGGSAAMGRPAAAPGLDLPETTPVSSSSTPDVESALVDSPALGYVQCILANDVAQFTGSNCGVVRFCNELLAGRVGYSSDLGLVADNATDLFANTSFAAANASALVEGNYTGFIADMIAANNFFGHTGFAASGFDSVNLTTGYLVPGNASEGIRINVSAIADNMTAANASFFLSRYASVCVQLHTCGHFEPTGAYGSCAADIAVCSPIYIGDYVCDQSCNTPEHGHDGMLCRGCAPMLAVHDACVHAPAAACMILVFTTRLPIGFGAASFGRL